MELHPGARIVASRAYTLKTLAVRHDALIAVDCGTKRLGGAGATLRASAGHGVLLARGGHWDISNEPAGGRPYQALALAFPDELLRELDARADIGRLPAVAGAHVLRMDDELATALRRTLAPAAGTDALAGTLLRHRVMEVLLLLAQRGFRFAPAAALAFPERVRRLVARHPAAAWSAAALATACHVSESTLRRRLHEEGGTTLAGLVREVRLETALALLQSRRLAIGEVARQCGWQSHSRFTAAFQQRWGIAPSVVRARLTDHAQDSTPSG